MPVWEVQDGNSHRCRPRHIGFVGVSAGAGAFIGSYLKKKGENLATKKMLLIL